MSEESFHPGLREFQGPARLETIVHELELDPIQDHVASKRQHFTRRFGPEGVGWEAQLQPVPHTREEKLVQNMGMLIYEVLVTPDGDINAQTWRTD